MKICSQLVAALSVLQFANAFYTPATTSVMINKGLALSPDFENAAATSNPTNTNTNNERKSASSMPPDQQDFGPKNKENYFMARGQIPVKNIWEKLSPVRVQGSSLKTWSFNSGAIERVGVFMKTNGREMYSNVELWNGPDNTPMKVGVYIEDGAQRNFNCVLETPRGTSAVAVRNTGYMEFPLDAAIEANVGNDGMVGEGKGLAELATGRLLQGGSIHTYPFDYDVDKVQVLLHTDGRPLSARLELLQGPNCKKQVVEVYSEDGLSRPFCMVMDTPGASNVVRVINTATMEYPITAYVESFPIMSSGRKSSNNSNSNSSPFGKGSQTNAYGSNYNGFQSMGTLGDNNFFLGRN